jgi:hypothetical protein
VDAVVVGSSPIWHPWPSGGNVRSGFLGLGGLRKPDRSWQLDGSNRLVPGEA